MLDDDKAVPASQGRLTKLQLDTIVAKAAGATIERGSHGLRLHALKGFRWAAGEEAHTLSVVVPRGRVRAAYAWAVIVKRLEAGMAVCCCQACEAYWTERRLTVAEYDLNKSS